MAALPATGAYITMGGVRNYFGLSGQICLSTLGNFIVPAVTTNICLSATFGGWQNPNQYGTASGVAPADDEGPGAVYPAPDGVNTI
tara:strand:- start:2504 stop:2761 length:258 start_codon:yes stop_codon:yes gene_type:complete